MGKIGLVYGYDYAHTADSITMILKELTATNAVRDLMVPLALTNNNSNNHSNNMFGQDHAAADMISHVRRLIFEFEDNSTVGNEMALGCNSDSSEESDCKSRACRSINRKKNKEPQLFQITFA